jgi:cytoskeletal protein RodZ
MENAVEETSPEQEVHETVGARLKASRERIGMSLADLAAQTRVPTRHLESIERSEFDALPGQTYTLGFARAYARAIDLDPVDIGNRLRAELSESGHEGYQAPIQNYEPTDPARVPSKTLAWTAAGFAALLLAGYAIFRSMTFGDVATAPVKNAPPAIVSANAASASSDVTAGSGTVVLTATDNVWVKVYDAEQKRLYEREMVAGDSFNVPPGANRPMIVTGRPQALDIKVNGKVVPPLGAADVTIADVEISADKLLSRPPVQTTDKN